MKLLSSFCSVFRCILDGEMLVWDKSSNRFAEFGSNQEIGIFLFLILLLIYLTHCWFSCYDMYYYKNIHLFNFLSAKAAREGLASDREVS